MKISVITAVFNSAETIEDCIKSVAGQNYSDIEHIIADGGSTDGTIEVIEVRGLTEKMQEESGYDRLLKKR